MGRHSFTAAQEPELSAPCVFLLDGRRLAETKRRIKSGDKSFAAALAKLERDARRAMQQNHLSVVTKVVAVPESALAERRTKILQLFIRSELLGFYHLSALRTEKPTMCTALENKE
jgi:hypothetical protein